MKGKVGVGYRLFHTEFLGKKLGPGNIVNDHAMLENKVAEFSYTPVIDDVEGFALSKEDFMGLLEIPYWKKMIKYWSKLYKKKV